MKFSIIIPAKNEAQGLSKLLPVLTDYGASEIIVVDDGSTDATREVCEQHGCKVVSHSDSRGNGAAVKSGLRAAENDVVLLMDADGQHDPVNIPALLAAYEQGADLVVGARSSAKSQANIARGFGNRVYNALASWMVGRQIDDLTSGFRVANRQKMMRFMYLYPNGFSYPTTSTMAFFRAGYEVTYVPIEMPPRIGKSHMRLIRDGARFFLIIFKIGTLYSPLKLFVPLAALHFIIGLLYYSYTYITAGTFTNMSAVLFTSSILIFLMGLVSEQISALMYKDQDLRD